MTLIIDVEGHGHILFPMGNYVSVHTKMNTYDQYFENVLENRHKEDSSEYTLLAFESGTTSIMNFLIWGSSIIVRDLVNKSNINIIDQTETFP